MNKKVIAAVVGAIAGFWIVSLLHADMIWELAGGAVGGLVLAYFF